MDGVDEKKSPPPSRRKEKTRERAGAKHPQALPGEIKQRPRKPTKSADAPSIRHDLKYTQSTQRNQPIKGNPQNPHTHRRHPKQAAAASAPRTIRPRRATMNPDAQAPRSPTRLNGAVKRDERGSKTSETGGEPQPAKQARAGDSRTRRRR